MSPDICLVVVKFLKPEKLLKKIGKESKAREKSPGTGSEAFAAHGVIVHQ